MYGHTSRKFYYMNIGTSESKPEVDPVKPGLYRISLQGFLTNPKPSSKQNCLFFLLLSYSSFFVPSLQIPYTHQNIASDNIPPPSFLFTSRLHCINQLIDPKYLHYIVILFSFNLQVK
jgi:hypothetical protein